MKVRNVLVFPAGTEIAQEILSALISCKEVRLFGAGVDKVNHGQFSFPEYYSLPSIYDEGWLPALRELCLRLKIDYIFPAYDDVIVALSRVQDTLPCAVITSPSWACDITRSKSATYKFLADAVRVPQLFSNASEISKFPVLVKPDKGQGSAGVTIIYNADELQRAVASVRDPIICEYLPGEEYTIDCFSDRQRGVLFAGARLRQRTRNGISVSSHTVCLSEARVIAEKIGSRLQLCGAWFFQMKRAEDGELTLLEVAPRIAGAMALHRVLGVNFPLLSIYEHERIDTSILSLDLSVHMDRALRNRYRHNLLFDVVYLDLDDTIILRNEVNPEIAKFIFQCLNRGIKVKLLTRHAGDLNATLAMRRLSNVFDEIIHVPKNRKKYEYIVEKDAIFIDDSYAERAEVAFRCGIPTMDCSMIEILTEQSNTRMG